MAKKKSSRSTSSDAKSSKKTPMKKVNTVTEVESGDFPHVVGKKKIGGNQGK